MEENLNKYYVLLKHGFYVELLQEMSESEIDSHYKQILKQL